MAPASRGQAALAGTRKTLDVGLAIPQIAASEPERSCAAALSLEDWRTEPNSGQWSPNRLLEARVSGAADAVGSLNRRYGLKGAAASRPPRATQPGG